MSAFNLLRNSIRGYRKSVNPPYHENDIWVVLTTLVILILIPITVITVLVARDFRSRAFSVPTLYLSPASQSLEPGSEFSIEVREDTLNQAINAVQANLSYDDSKIDLISIDPSNIFEFQLENTGRDGEIRMGRGSFTPRTGEQIVATLNFRVKTNAVGSSSIAFITGSSLVTSDGNYDILENTVGGNYNIVKPPVQLFLSPESRSVSQKEEINDE